MNAAIRDEPTGWLRVRHEFASVALARNSLAADLRARALEPSMVEVAALVVSELLTNAIRHTPNAGSLDVSWVINPPDLEVAVDDQSRVLPERRASAVDAPGGRGLRIVEALCTSWGIDESIVGKRVWVRLLLVPPLGPHADWT